MRQELSGKPEPMELPALAKNEKGSYRLAKAGDKATRACRPSSLLVRGGVDLWIRADCGGGGDSFPAVFRMGRPQEPIVLP